MSVILGAAAALLGLAFGSFFNVCIYRIPRRMSIATPPSHCPRCRRPIRFYDNIPGLSWFMLRGRCRDCGQRFSVRYAVVELLTGALFLATYLKSGYSPATLKGLVFISLLIVLSFIDLDHQVIPFRLSLPGLALGLAGGLLPPPGLLDALLGAGAGAAFVLASWALWRYGLAAAFRRHGVDQREGMGWGDLPFAAMIGAFVGLKGTVVALFAAVVAGVVVGVIGRVAKRTARGQPVPFGPFLALGGLAGMFFGRAVFDWYVGLMLPR